MPSKPKYKPGDLATWRRTIPRWPGDTQGTELKSAVTILSKPRRRTGPRIAAGGVEYALITSGVGGNGGPRWIARAELTPRS